MKKKFGVNTFNNAINGIIYTIKSETNMKIHLFCAILVLILSLITDISKLEIILIILLISIVISLELVNTAIEKIVDVISPEYSEIARIIKDIAAGAVLVVSLASIAIAYLIFYDRLLKVYFNADNFLKIVGRIGHISIIIITIIIIIVISLKAYFNKGSALEGGMPSGHSAIAFSLFTIIYFLSKNPRINIISFILALLVSQSRIKSKIHTFLEVFIGGIIGFLITFIILSILYNLKIITQI